MAVNIENLSTEVIPEPEETHGAAAQPAARRQEAEQMRVALARWLRDRSRTAAEGFDD